MNIPDTFAQSRQLLQEYTSERLSHEHASVDVTVLTEAKIRLEQLDYLLGRVREIEASKPFVDGEDMQVRLYAECFYYIAARFVSLCRKNRTSGLRGFNCRVISEIRNHLIEHTEQSGGQVLGWSWKHEDGRGPMLEGRSTSTRSLDQGLFRNANAMRDRLDGTLRDAIGRLRS